MDGSEANHTAGVDGVWAKRVPAAETARASIRRMMMMMIIVDGSIGMVPAQHIRDSRGGSRAGARRGPLLNVSLSNAGRRRFGTITCQLRFPGPQGDQTRDHVQSEKKF